MTTLTAELSRTERSALEKLRRGTHRLVPLADELRPGGPARWTPERKVYLISRLALYADRSVTDADELFEDYIWGNEIWHCPCCGGTGECPACMQKERIESGGASQEATA